MEQRIFPESIRHLTRLFLSRDAIIFGGAQSPGIKPLRIKCLENKETTHIIVILVDTSSSSSIDYFFVTFLQIPQLVVGHQKKNDTVIEVLNDAAFKGGVVSIMIQENSYQINSVVHMRGPNTRLCQDTIADMKCSKHQHSIVVTKEIMQKIMNYYY